MDEYAGISLDIEVIPKLLAFFALSVNGLANPHVFKRHLKPRGTQKQPDLKQYTFGKAFLYELGRLGSLCLALVFSSHTGHHLNFGW